MKLKGKMRMFIVFMCVITFLLVACQPTPQNEIVINKNDGKLEEKIEKKDAKSNVSEELTVNRPLEYSDDYMTKNSHIIIDADVIWNDVKQIPVATTEKYILEQSDCDKIIDIFMGNDTLIPNGTSLSVKSDIELAIINAKMELSKWNSYANLPENEKAQLDKSLGNLEKKEDRIMFLEQMITEYTNDYNNYLESEATLAKDNAEISVELKDNRIDLWSQTKDSNISNLSISNLPSGAAISYAKYVNVPMSNNQDSTLVQDEEVIKSANNIAEEIMQKLGLRDYVLSEHTSGTYNLVNSDKPTEFLSLTYSKHINKIPISSYLLQINDAVTSENLLSHEEMSKQIYAPLAMPPKLNIMIDEKKDVIGFSCFYPLGKIEINNSNVQILEFDEILEQFKKNMNFRKYANNEESSEIIIKEIQLSLLTITKKEDINNLHILPVWDFIGYFNNSEEINSPVGKQTFLTINAIDGSVIDRNLGY